MKKFVCIAALLFAAPLMAQTAAPTAPVTSTFSVTTAVASLPVVGETVAANISGAALQVTPNVAVTNINVLSSGVQVYLGGLRYSYSLDKLIPKNWADSGWHFKVSGAASMGVSEYNTQHIAVMAGGSLSAEPPGTSKFSFVGGVYYLNAAGVSGHAVVALGPQLSW